jgi:uncharacterized RDD family membrane protein YckC
MNIPLQPDAAHRVPEEAALIDPEAYDASEQQFAASLEYPGSGMVMEKDSIEDCRQSDVPAVRGQNAASIDPRGLAPAFPTSLADVPDPGAWRQEVAKRLTSYRARRQPREPRYPSLQLKFEPSGQSGGALPCPSESRSRLIFDGSAAAAQVAPSAWPADDPPFEAPLSNPPAETTARVIPFPRSTAAPPKPLEELAEPLQLFPRILDVPEVTPPLPALGGILIEPAEEEPNRRRPGIEIPLQTSQISRRFLAAGIDGTIVAAALGVFAYIFFRITAAIAPLKLLAEMGAIVLGILWAGYQYLLLTYVGSTPGLMLAKLRLSQFDGNAVSRQARRWRALASILSALSLGLGYAWCMLDEDQLCWHDRITKTHLAPKHCGENG